MRRKIFIIFAIIQFLGLISSKSFSGISLEKVVSELDVDLPGQTYKVVRVIDGDTFVVAYKGKNETLRMIGVDTPETKHPQKKVERYGKEASEYTKKLLEGKKVELKFDVQKRDKYGRILAYVYLGDIFVNAQLVRDGMAQVMTVPPNVKYQAYFVQIQKEARENKRGLWL